MTDLTYAIGDIHGCSDALTRLLARIDDHRAGRPADIVCLGDYVDRGPDSAGVLRILRDRAAREPGRLICLRGNHEQMMLDAGRRGPPRSGSRTAVTRHSRPSASPGRARCPTMSCPGSRPCRPSTRTPCATTCMQAFAPGAGASIPTPQPASGSGSPSSTCRSTSESTSFTAIRRSATAIRIAVPTAQTSTRPASSGDPDRRHPRTGSPGPARVPSSSARPARLTQRRATGAKDRLGAVTRPKIFSRRRDGRLGTCPDVSRRGAGLGRVPSGDIVSFEEQSPKPSRIASSSMSHAFRRRARLAAGDGG